MKVQTINSQAANINDSRKASKEPNFNAILRIYDQNNLMTNKQKDFLYKKALKNLNYDWLYAWVEAPNVPIEVQVLKGNYKSHVDLLDDVMPPMKGKENLNSEPYTLLDRWLTMLSKK